MNHSLMKTLIYLCLLLPIRMAWTMEKEIKTIKIWDLQSKKEMHTLRILLPMALKMSLSGDGKRLAVISLPLYMSIYDVESGNLVHTLLPKEKSIGEFRFSPEQFLLGSSEQWSKESPASNRLLIHLNTTNEDDIDSAVLLVILPPDDLRNPRSLKVIVLTAILKNYLAKTTPNDTERCFDDFIAFLTKGRTDNPELVKHNLTMVISTLDAPSRQYLMALLPQNKSYYNGKTLLDCF